MRKFYLKFFVVYVFLLFYLSHLLHLAPLRTMIEFSQVKINISNLSTIDTIPNDNLVKIYEFNWSFSPPRQQIFYWFNKYSEQIEGFSKPRLKSLYKRINDLLCHVYHLTDMYATYSGCFANDKYLIQPKNGGPWEIRMAEDGTVVGAYENVIAVGHSQIKNYAHYFLDALSPLIIFPEEIRQKSFIIGFGIKTLVQETLESLGFENKIIFLEQGEWIYCKNLYVAVDPRPHLSHYGYAFNKLSKQLRKFYKVDTIIPSKYLLVNRESKIRSIYNFDELFAAVKQRFPDKPWKKGPDLIATIRETAILWSKVKFVFMPTGSGPVKCLFMAKRTAMVLAFADMFDTSVLMHVGTVNVYCIVFTVKNMKHFSISENYVDIELALKAFEAGISILERGKWPEPHGDESFVC